MKTTITILSVLASLNILSQESCFPTFKEIFNYQVGDKYSYKEELWSLSEKPELLNYNKITFEVMEKFVYGDTTVYVIDGKLPESAIFSCESRYYQTGYRCDTVVLIDSTNHFLNLCNSSWFQFSIYSEGPFLSRIKSNTINNNILKSYGGKENIYDVDTSLNSSIEIEENYMKGFGIYSQSFQNSTGRIIIQLENYIKSGDTIYLNQINETQVKLQAKLYPNPVSDYLFVETENNSKIQSITVIDVLGRKTEIGAEEFSADAIRIDITKLKKGMYFLIIDTDKHHISKKFIKK